MYETSSGKGYTSTHGSTAGDYKKRVRNGWKQLEKRTNFKYQVEYYTIEELKAVGMVEHVDYECDDAECIYCKLDMDPNEIVKQSDAENICWS